jgi:hypothetical protein
VTGYSTLLAVTRSGCPTPPTDGQAPRRRRPPMRRPSPQPTSREIVPSHRLRLLEPSQAVRSPLGNCDRYGPRSQHTARLRCPPGASILQSRVSIEIWAPDPLAPSGARRSTSRALRSRRIAGFTPSALAVFTAWHPRAYRPSSSSRFLARLRSFVPKPFVNQLAIGASSSTAFSRSPHSAQRRERLVAAPPRTSLAAVALRHAAKRTSGARKSKAGRDRSVQ